MSDRTDTLLTLKLDRVFRLYYNRVFRAMISSIVKQVWLHGSDLIPALGALQKRASRFIYVTTGHTLYSASESVRAPINRYELRVYSQHGEDGILMHIFSDIGVTDRRFVEIGIGDGRECNTANLIWNLGWNGMLIDADHDNVTRALRYYSSLGTRRSVKVVESRVTAENVNDLLKGAGISGSIDLLSIDIDGNDYWVWKAITQVSPRVVVIEYNASLGSTMSATVRYDPRFRRGEGVAGFYYGASLRALSKLSESKGYVLVGCDSSGSNAFFVRGESMGKLKATNVSGAFFPYSRKSMMVSLRRAESSIHEMDWVEV